MSRYPYGVHVRARLLRLHKTQHELARSLGYSPSYISMVLNGYFPAQDLRQRINELLTRWEQNA